MFLGYNYGIMHKVLDFRYWIVGAAIVVAAIFFVACKQQNAAEKYKRHRAEYCAALVATTEQKKSCAEETASARNYLPWRYILFIWPEGITTWAIIATGFVIAWQSSETRKAAQSARDSIRLQELAMQQWIVLNNWRSEIITTSGLLYADGSPLHRLRIRVDIVNPSTAPLTLTAATIVFHLPINAPSTWGAPKDHFLTPNAPYTVDVPLDVSAGLVESFSDGIVTFRIEGKFIHVGSLKRSATQDMSGILVCSKSGTRFESEMPMHPKE
jgi:hypothetical protein